MIDVIVKKQISFPVKIILNFLQHFDIDILTTGVFANKHKIKEKASE